MEPSKSEGERQVAKLAKQRLRDKLAAQPTEYTIRLKSIWMKKLFVALCQKNQLKTYRYARQKYTTVMLWVSPPFINEILWPEFIKYSRMFEELVNEILQELTSKIHEVKEEDEVVIAGELPVRDCDRIK